MRMQALGLRPALGHERSTARNPGSLGRSPWHRGSKRAVTATASGLRHDSPECTADDLEMTVARIRTQQESVDTQPGTDVEREIRAMVNSREPQQVPIERLLPADSPRLAGEDVDHARMLSESDVRLPPILVNRRSMRVIDGMHRLSAALLKGQTVIDVCYFNGDDDDSFIAAVMANVTHGLPLSLADREAAAARILRSHPQWSDRAIARATGLAGKTVAVIRQRDITGTDSGFRIGRDGRVRPVNAAEGRRIAQQIIEERPHASLREVARAAGISPNTVRSVRESLWRLSGQDQPEESRQNGRRRGSQRHPHRGQKEADKESVLRRLSKDPALCYTESGRNLLRWLYQRAFSPQEWVDLMPTIPPHCSYTVAELARGCAREWLDFAKQLDHQATAPDELVVGPAFPGGN